MKRNRLLWIPVLAVLFVCGVALPAFAGQRVFVPRSLHEMRNPKFKGEVAFYAPDYDTRPRGEQVQAYVRAYRSLNYGAYPALGPDDARLAGLDSVGTDTASLQLIPATPSAVYQTGGPDISDAGNIQRFIPGYGYHRTSTHTPQMTNPVPSYTSTGRFNSLVVGKQGVTGNGNPPYASAYVPTPRRAPIIHAGP